MSHTDYIQYTSGKDLYVKPLPLTDGPWNGDLISGTENASLGSYSFAGLDDSTDYNVYNAAAGLGSEANTDQAVGILEKLIKKSDLVSVNNNTNSAARLALSAEQIVSGVVHSGGFVPTTTQFVAEGITEATDNHYNNRIILFTSNDLTGQVAEIEDYTTLNGSGQFTVSQLTEPPTDSTTFIML